MIDRGSFEKRWIESIPGISDIGGRLVVERTIHAFYLLQKVAKSRLEGKFVFKGELMHCDSKFTENPCVRV